MIDAVMGSDFQQCNTVGGFSAIALECLLFSSRVCAFLLNRIFLFLEQSC